MSVVVVPSGVIAEGEEAEVPAFEESIWRLVAIVVVYFIGIASTLQASIFVLFDFVILYLVFVF